MFVFFGRGGHLTDGRSGEGCVIGRPRLGLRVGSGAGAGGWGGGVGGLVVLVGMESGGLVAVYIRYGSEGGNAGKWDLGVCFGIGV